MQGPGGPPRSPPRPAQTRPSGTQGGGDFAALLAGGSSRRSTGPKGVDWRALRQQTERDASPPPQQQQQQQQPQQQPAGGDREAPRGSAGEEAPQSSAGGDGKAPQGLAGGDRETPQGGTATPPEAHLPSSRAGASPQEREGRTGSAGGAAGPGSVRGPGEAGEARAGVASPQERGTPSTPERGASSTPERGNAELPSQQRGGQRGGGNSEDTAKAADRAAPYAFKPPPYAPNSRPGSAWVSPRDAPLGDELDAPSASLSAAQFGVTLRRRSPGSTPPKGTAEQPQGPGSREVAAGVDEAGAAVRFPPEQSHSMLASAGPAAAAAEQQSAAAAEPAAAAKPAAGDKSAVVQQAAAAAAAAAEPAKAEAEPAAAEPAAEPRSTAAVEVAPSAPAPESAVAVGPAAAAKAHSAAAEEHDVAVAAPQQHSPAAAEQGRDAEDRPRAGGGGGAAGTAGPAGKAGAAGTAGTAGTASAAGTAVAVAARGAVGAARAAGTAGAAGKTAEVSQQQQQPRPVQEGLQGAVQGVSVEEREERPPQEAAAAKPPPSSVPGELLPQLNNGPASSDGPTSSTSRYDDAEELLAETGSVASTAFEDAVGAGAQPPGGLSGAYSVADLGRGNVSPGEAGEAGEGEGSRSAGPPEPPGEPPGGQGKRDSKEAREAAVEEPPAGGSPTTEARRAEAEHFAALQAEEAECGPSPLGTAAPLSLIGSDGAMSPAGGAPGGLAAVGEPSPHITLPHSGDLGRGVTPGGSPGGIAEGLGGLGLEGLGGAGDRGQGVAAVVSPEEGFVTGFDEETTFSSEAGSSKAWEGSTEASLDFREASLPLHGLGASGASDAAHASAAAAALGRGSPEQVHDTAWRSRLKHIFILTNAGRPVYSLHGDEADMVTFTATIHALLSFARSRGDPLCLLRAGDRTFVFLERGPLYLVGVSRGGDPPGVLARQLDLLHAHLLLILTSGFERVLRERPRYDPRRLLGGTQDVLRAFVASWATDASWLLGCVQPLPLPVPRRQAALAALQAAVKGAKAVYGVVFAGRRLVAAAHPGAPPLQPRDLTLLANFLLASGSFHAAPESVTPVCLPGFDASAFLHAHVAFVPQAGELCTVLLSADVTAFEALGAAAQGLHRDLRARGIVDAVVGPSGAAGRQQPPAAGPTSSTAPSGVPWGEPVPRGVLTIPGIPPSAGGGMAGTTPLLHFLYCLPGRRQYTAPAFTAPLDCPQLQRAVMPAYAEMHAAVYPSRDSAAWGSAGASFSSSQQTLNPRHSPGGSGAPGKGAPGRGDGMGAPGGDDAPPALRVRFARNDRFVSLVYTGPEYEVWALFDALTERPAAISLCQKLCAWLRGRQAELFAPA